MSWGTPNVSEQRARFMARPATGSPPAPPRRHFLIANLELEIPITTVFSGASIFLIANILRFFIISHKGLAVREQGLTLKHGRLISRHRFLVTRHSSPVTAFLIETPRLKNHVTSRKQNQSQFL